MCGAFRRRGRPAVAGLLVFLFAALPGPASGADAPDDAERARVLLDSIRPGSVVSSPLGMVVTSAPEATWAGVRMLEAGGNAVDAAVAAAFALTAADPGGSGIGGQTWLVLRLASGEERAVYCPAPVPLRIDRRRFRAARDGADLWGPMAAAVPTTVATLAHALRTYGTKPFAEVLAPAIETAEAGYRTQSFEHPYLGDYRRRLFDSDVLYPAYLTGPADESGLPGPAPLGTCVRLPNLARTLTRLAERGPEDFYTGEIATTLEREVLSAGGFLRRLDLSRVPGRVLDVAPVRGSYRGLTSLSVPAPGGGGVFTMALQALDALGAERLREPGLARGQAIVEAVRLARAEAAAHRGQTEIPDGPLRSEWLSPAWAERQARRIRADRAIPASELDAGQPFAAGIRGTTHVSVADAQGNVVSLTQTLGRYYGAAWAAPSLGFLLNGFLEPLVSDDPATAEYLWAGHSPQMPVSPLILLRDGRPVFLAGAPGSSRIPSILLNLVVALADGGDTLASAYARPRMIWEDDLAGPRVMLELAPPFAERDVSALAAMGYPNVWTLRAPNRDSGVFGGVYGVARDDARGLWQGVVDGRRAGLAAAPSRITPTAR
ncbi:MAG: gamma-glutamyltransferase [Thermoanaerobaculia bacterium]